MKAFRQNIMLTYLVIRGRLAVQSAKSSLSASFCICRAIEIIMNFITDNIAIGNYLDATDVEAQRAAGIESLLCLDGKLKPSDAEAMGLKQIISFSLIDGRGNRPETFESAVRAVGRLSAGKPKLLVQCHAGRSRSVIVVAAHLMLTRQLSDSEALDFINERREIALTPGIETLLMSAWLLPG